jgi:hypothetical protein
MLVMDDDNDGASIATVVTTSGDVASSKGGRK